MITSIMLFVLGIVLLWGGTETVLRRVPKLATWLRVSPLVVTVMLVAVMTSLPEFCVSLFAALRGQPAAAVGNIVGSNFVTLTFVAGLCALWRPIVVGPTLRERMRRSVASPSSLRTRWLWWGSKESGLAIMSGASASSVTESSHSNG